MLPLYISLLDAIKMLCIIEALDLFQKLQIHQFRRGTSTRVCSSGTYQSGEIKQVYIFQNRQLG